MKIVTMFAVLGAVVMASAIYIAQGRAQGSGGALVVATCGTLPLAYTVGATRALTVNTDGQVCQ